MLTSQLHDLVKTDMLKANSLCKITEYMSNNVQGKNVIVCLKLEIVQANGSRIGQPTDIEKANIGATHSVAAVAKPLYQPLYNTTNNSNAAMNSSNAAKNNNNTSPYGSSPNPYGSTSSNHMAAAPIVRSDSTSGTPITAISALNMYNNRWMIKARLTSKSDIRTWSNAKGEGSLFSCEFLDASGTDIRATLFKEGVAKFYDMLHVGRVYRVAGGRLKIANLQYNTCKSEYEITLDQNSEIALDNDTEGIEQQAYNFIKIADVEQVEEKKSVDILGIVKSVSEPVTIVSKKSGNELIKCDALVVDDSGAEIQVTFWGEKARVAPQQLSGQPVVAFRRARVGDYGGKSLSAGDGIDVQPDIPQAKALLQWWQSTGGQVATRSLSSSVGGRVEGIAERKSISCIKEEGMGYNSDKPEWLTIKGTVSFIKKDKEGGAWYTACYNSGEPCKNMYKVSNTPDGQWFCEKCSGTFSECVRRWIFSGVIEDETASTWVSFFNPQAEQLLGGVTANEVFKQAYENNNDQDVYESFFAKANFTEWIFKCKVKQETHNDEARVKTSVHSMYPVDYVKESNDILAELAKF
jgi:replication factor A1